MYPLHLNYATTLWYRDTLFVLIRLVRWRISWVDCARRPIWSASTSIYASLYWSLTTV